jgi:hypothetical protein
VVSLYSTATRAVAQIDERLGVLKEQAGKAATAINKIAGKASPALANILPTGAFATDQTPAPEAVKPFPHLLIIQPRDPKAAPYFFNLDTAAFDELRRTTEFRWAGLKGGLKQLDTLRALGAQLQPLTLTTGYGDVLGTWCLKSLDEDQSALMAGGIPRKQSFNLEFVRYGDDMQNI